MWRVGSKGLFQWICFSICMPLLRQAISTYLCPKSLLQQALKPQPVVSNEVDLFPSSKGTVQYTPPKITLAFEATTTIKSCVSTTLSTDADDDDDDYGGIIKTIESLTVSGYGSKKI
ncbi:uncharacterized protein LOC131994181 [Stomoxys calcitrans]|uniref:uncharacterized protein LOC131994181 n=1 Tax=Stomoxys calcitrans TaxID=35570 RepID=UPI0027E28084|nr:uncharacterized protein LOC131994181 [Stomoxys calcitrans]